MVTQADTIEWQETDSVLESLILEANLIKQHLPKYNTKEKDNKSFNFIVITDEDFPRILTVRQRSMELAPEAVIEAPIYKKFGPYPNGTALREALKVLRKIFPYRDTCQIGQKRRCFNAQIGLCPGVCAVNNVDTNSQAYVQAKEAYRKTIWRIAMFLEGRKYDLVKKLEQEMTALAKEMKFEEANGVKRILFALSHIQDVALIRSDESDSAGDEMSHRIEAYDVAHTSGKNIVGVMVVATGNTLTKSQYRKFKLKTVDQAHETNSIREILARRFSHAEWPKPHIIVVDGNDVQRNAAEAVIKELKLDTHVVSVVKDERHKPRAILGEEQLFSKLSDADSKNLQKTILLANGEAHRFALAYHRRVRGKISFK